MSIERHADVRGYFRERLVASMRKRRVDTDETTEYYLVNLLADHAIAPDEETLARPLVELLAEAVEASGPDQLRKFREAGDTALYVCGFFGDHLERRGVGRDYVITMGGRAYSAAGSLAQRGYVARSAAELSRTFEELCAKFDAFARVLDDVREATTMRTPQEIVRLYERWQKTRSPLLAERLEQEGVFPTDGSGGKGMLH